MARTFTVRLLSFLTLLFVSVAARAADVEFLHVWPGWRNAEAFDRISEYFGGGENHGGQVILRTQPGVRAGYYFLMRMKSATAHAGVRIEVNVIRPDAPEPKVFAFAAALPAGEAVLQLGLTGPDWPGGEKKNPVAWKITVVGADGKLLNEHKSFLWEKPAK
jgi:hypothetical protein